jgi:hypothetical protein
VLYRHATFGGANGSIDQNPEMLDEFLELLKALIFHSKEKSAENVRDSWEGLAGY